jgi:hypothetical protein
MEQVGMVHALEEIQRLLAMDGCLIDIHPVAEAPFIKVFQGGSAMFVESDPGYDYEQGLLQAEDAIAQVVQRGLFVIEGSSEFDLITYASSGRELQDYWEKYGAYIDDPKDAAVEARIVETFARVEEVMRRIEKGAEVATHERARITRLNPNATRSGIGK